METRTTKEVINYLLSINGLKEGHDYFQGEEYECLKGYLGEDEADFQIEFYSLLPKNIKLSAIAKAFNSPHCESLKQFMRKNSEEIVDYYPYYSVMKKLERFAVIDGGESIESLNDAKKVLQNGERKCISTYLEDFRFDPFNTNVNGERTKKSDKEILGEMSEALREAKELENEGKIDRYLLVELKACIDDYYHSYMDEGKEEVVVASQAQQGTQIKSQTEQSIQGIHFKEDYFREYNAIKQYVKGDYTEEVTAWRRTLTFHDGSIKKTVEVSEYGIYSFVGEREDIPEGFKSPCITANGFISQMKNKKTIEEVAEGKSKNEEEEESIQDGTGKGFMNLIRECYGEAVYTEVTKESGEHIIYAGGHSYRLIDKEKDDLAAYQDLLEDPEYAEYADELCTYVNIDGVEYRLYDLVENYHLLMDIDPDLMEYIENAKLEAEEARLKAKATEEVDYYIGAGGKLYDNAEDAGESLNLAENGFPIDVSDSTASGTIPWEEYNEEDSQVDYIIGKDGFPHIPHEEMEQ